jgi:hypothetical protein
VMPKASTTEWVCSACRQTKTASKQSYQCGLCQNLVCKKCLHTLKKGTFSFFKTTPPELTHDVYCESCHHQTVVPALEKYNDTMQRAEDMFIFEKAMKHVPVINCSKHKVIVEDCPDKKETILRLAFLAAEQNFNAVIKVVLACEKVRMHGYQTSKWSGSGFPALINQRGLREQS